MEFESAIEKQDSGVNPSPVSLELTIYWRNSS